MSKDNRIAFIVAFVVALAAGLVGAFITLLM